MAKMSLEDVIIKMKEINPNILITGETSKLVGKTDIRNRRYIICKCLIDGYEWESEISLLLRGRGCNKCADIQRANKKRINIEDVKNEFIIKGYTPLFDKYKSNNIRLSAENSEGYKVSICYDKLKSGKTPSIFGNDNPYTMENISLWLSRNNTSIELLDEEYIDSNHKFKIKCLIHNDVFYMSWNCLHKGTSCPKCAIESNSGENHHGWKGGITSLTNYLRIQVSEWRGESFKKHKSKCDITGLKLRDNIIHHLFPFANIVKESIEAFNFEVLKNIGDYNQDDLNSLKNKCIELHYEYGLGVCLSKEEHINFHRIYGNKNTTLAQYEEYKEMRLKELSL